jgi:hypothetical protein
MKQKTYVKPSLMVVELEIQSQLLTSTGADSMRLKNYNKEVYEEYE